jgi:DNA polymerase-3 subunit alpha
LCHRADLGGMNRRILESLIKAGALDCLGSRGTLLQNIGSILSLAQREQRLRATGQSTMFDLWGGAMPVPMPSLELQTADIPVRDKLVWEKELMGVYLSEHPFSSLAGKGTSFNTTLCGQIDAELVGHSVTVAGMLASVRYLFTRDRRPFASVVLEDLDGRIEVMVWPKVYADTKDLWQEGNLLLVEGKVRLRDDQVQLNCDSVRQYQPGAVQAEEPVISEPAETPVVAEEPLVPVVSRRLVISITQGTDEASDTASLQRLIDTLKEFPGQDEVSLRITNEARVINLKMPDMSISYCPELHEKLVRLVGEGGIKTEEE